MNAIERRLRALETAAQIKPFKPPRCVIVGLGETLEEVLEREGIVVSDGPEIEVIARVIVDPARVARPRLVWAADEATPRPNEESPVE